MRPDNTANHRRSQAPARTDAGQSDPGDPRTRPRREPGNFRRRRRPGRDLPVLALFPARHPRRDRAPPGRHQQVRPSADPGQPARLRRLTTAAPGSRPRRTNPPPGRTHTASRGERPAPPAARHRSRRTAAGRDQRLPATVLTRHHPITIRPPYWTPRPCRGRVQATVLDASAQLSVTTDRQAQDNLLLRRPAQSPHPQRLHQPGPDPRTPRRIRDPLQRHRPAV